MLFYAEDDGGGSAAGAGVSDGAGTLLSGVEGAGAGAAAGAGQTGATGTASPGWAKEDGAFEAGWIDRLPEELRNEAALKVVPSVQLLAKNYVETKKLVGSKLTPPGADAKPEQVAEWRKTLGVPETLEGYYGEAKTLRPADVPEGMWDANSEKEFLSIAHKHNLTPQAVKDVFDYYGKSITQSLTTSAEAEKTILAQEKAKLTQEFGAEFDANISLAARVAQTVGLPTDHPLFTNADAVKAFVKFGKLLSEDKIVKGDAVAGLGANISEQIRDITDPKGLSPLSRAYRGEMGQPQQLAAQKQLHDLMTAQKQAA